MHFHHFIPKCTSLSSECTQQEQTQLSSQSVLVSLLFVHPSQFGGLCACQNLSALQSARYNPQLLLLVKEQTFYSPFSSTLW